VCRCVLVGGKVGAYGCVCLCVYLSGVRVHVCVYVRACVCLCMCVCMCVCAPRGTLQLTMCLGLPVYRRGWRADKTDRERAVLFPAVAA